MGFGHRCGHTYDRMTMPAERRAAHVAGGHHTDFVTIPQGRVRYVTAGGFPGSGQPNTTTPSTITATSDPRPVIVLTPDPPNGLEHLAPLVDAIAERYPVVAFEPLGFGWSRPRGSYDHSLLHGAKMVRALLDALGIRRCVLAFPCVAGFIALEAAARDPMRITGCLLSQTPSWEKANTWLDRVDTGKHLRRPVWGQLAVDLAGQRLVKRWYEVAEPDAARRESALDIHERRRRHGAGFSLASALQGIFTSPGPFVGMHMHPSTVVLWGVDDRTHPDHHADSILSDLPEATVIPIQDAGHFPDVAQPDLFLKALEGLLTTGAHGARPARRQDAEHEAAPAATRRGPASHVHPADQGVDLGLGGRH